MMSVFIVKKGGVEAAGIDKYRLAPRALYVFGCCYKVECVFEAGRRFYIGIAQPEFPFAVA